jgi:hypothetical protein
MGFFKPKGQKLGTEGSVTVDRLSGARIEIPAAAAVVANTTAVKAAVNSTGSTLVITTGITNPAYPRALTATAGGTAGDIKAIQVTVTGTNFNDEVITETLPVFTVDTAGTVQGSKAFKTVTQISIPTHDGNGATTAIGFNEKMGIPFKLSRNSVIAAYLNNVKEGTAPTVAVSSTALESNTVDLNSALNGTIVHVDLLV